MSKTTSTAPAVNAVIDPSRTGYKSPLESRNASREMREIWSDQRKFSTWRRIWHALAKSEHELGFPVTKAQVDAIGAHLSDIDFAAADRYEATLRHDVMAHVHTLGDAAPEARAIIHLGATSQDVVCNTDVLLQHDALSLIALKLARVVDRLATLAAAHRDLPCLGFTHYQPAQPVTFGKRAMLWAQDFAVAHFEVMSAQESLRLRGLRGATGTQASYLALLGGDGAKVDALEESFAKHLGWSGSRWPGCAQTYPRIADAKLLSAMAIAACAVHKTCNDIRLLCNLREVDEPFEKHQVGSSAMPYKRNPMRCERATGLARFVQSLAHNAFDTASTQWLERTLDDSSNRRLSIPESFLALDGALDIMVNVAGGLVVYPKVCAARLANEMPFLATENLMMAAVRAGADRQDAHEAIRTHAIEAARRMKEEGAPNDLLQRLAGDPLIQRAKIDMKALEATLNPADFVGRSGEQVDSMIAAIVEPLRKHHGEALRSETQLRV
ncbi:MAG: adenylosuccinate lyase [Planctomycetota bacterium]|nr:adenylosuccinate lyase [Planctomycetota bacterium]MDA1105234.1 adenylosuccinate lyase [Planctomycetota bacterium]